MSNPDQKKSEEIHLSMSRQEAKDLYDALSNTWPKPIVRELLEVLKRALKE